MPKWIKFILALPNQRKPNFILVTRFVLSEKEGCFSDKIKICH